MNTLKPAEFFSGLFYFQTAPLIPLPVSSTGQALIKEGEIKRELYFSCKVSNEK
jgi:hypothetical protein